MNGDLILKRLGDSWECPNLEFHKCTLRRCPVRKKEWRRKQHQERKEKDNAASRIRYHQKYKIEKNIPTRSRQPLELKIFKKREAYKNWAASNWENRVKYAREYRRRKNPLIGIKEGIAAARQSGNFSELIERIGFALVRVTEVSNERFCQSEHCGCCV